MIDSKRIQQLGWLVGIGVLIATSGASQEGWASRTQEATVQAAQNVRGGNDINVDTLDDELNTDGDCSLREAVQAANTNLPVDNCLAGSTSPDFINLGVGTYPVSTQLVLEEDVLIDGQGVEETFLDGGDSNSLILVDFGVTVDLAQLTLQNGKAPVGGCLYNNGDLDISDVRVMNCEAVYGGGMMNLGDVDGQGLQLISNTANYEPLFRGGSGEAQGGGLYNAGPFFMQKFLVQNNTAQNTEEFEEVQVEGGGIYNANADLFIDSGLLAGNVAVNNSFIANTFARGGGIFARSIYGTLINVTASGNQAIGSNSSLGIGGAALAFLESGGARGGGIVFPDAAIGFFGSTITNNTASHATGGVHGSVLLFSSINVVNTAPSNNNCSNSDVETSGYNLLETAESHCPTAATDEAVARATPLLAPLAYNGGFADTHRLLAGSPAINKGSAAPLDRGGPGGDFCSGNDGRFFNRGEAGPCDIGAYEITENVGVSKYYLGSGDAIPGTSIPYEISAYNPGYYDATVNVMDLIPAPLTNCTWVCAPDQLFYRGLPLGGFGSTCSAGPNSGNIMDNASIGGGESAEGFPGEFGGNVVYTLSCDIPASATGSISNTASITSSGIVDPVADNNSSTETTTLQPTHDLISVVPNNPDKWDADENLVLQYQITNPGPSNATNLNFGIYLGAPSSIVSVNCGGGIPVRAQDRNQNRSVPTLCTWPAFGVLGPVTVTIEIDINGAPLSMVNIQSDVYADGLDPDYSNNTVSTDIAVDLYIQGGFEPADFSEFSNTN